MPDTILSVRLCTTRPTRLELLLSLRGEVTEGLMNLPQTSQLQYKAEMRRERRPAVRGAFPHKHGSAGRAWFSISVLTKEGYMTKDSAHTPSQPVV